MAAIIFDTHAFVKELTHAGMPEEQAEVLARSRRHSLTKIGDTGFERIGMKHDLVWVL